MSNGDATRTLARPYPSGSRATCFRLVTAILFATSGCSSTSGGDGSELGDAGQTGATAADSTGPDSASSGNGSQDAGSDTSADPIVDEHGVWSLARYDLGEGLSDIAMAREDAFLLSFDSDAGVVTTAACGSRDGWTPDDSVCRLSRPLTGWSCRCFGYAFEGNQMQWREFDAGATPPDVIFEPGVSSDTYVTLAPVPTAPEEYRFQPLPMDVFASDGATHAFEFARVAPILIDEAYSDPEASCAPCAQ